MNAIELLEQQHREVEELFEKFENAGERARKTKERLCREIADRLAMHAEIEEKLFYPESKQEDTEEILRESVEEHLADEADPRRPARDRGRRTSSSTRR